MSLCPDILHGMATSYSPREHPDLLRPARSVDWSKWADGNFWEIERGIDFDEEQTAKQARGAFTSWAYRRNLKPHARIVSDRVLIIQVEV